MTTFRTSLGNAVGAVGELHDASVQGRGRDLTDATLIGLGTALPPLARRQDDVCRELANLWQLAGADLDRWNRIVAGSGIEHRFGVMPACDVIALGTGERMEAFARHAPPLAAEAARKAMDDACIAAGDVTDLVVVTCTGFAAPGVDIALVDALGLDRSVRRTQVGFMGCFGAISGLRVAAGCACADRRAVALVVCVELCSLHVRNDTSPQNLVATALFADGAAAAVVAGPEAPVANAKGAAPRERLASMAGRGRRLRIGLGRPVLAAGGRDAMTWTITDAGFAMTLSREVPPTLRRAAADAAAGAGATAATRFAIHPGGGAILDAIDDGLNLGGGGGIAHARSTLRDIGNVSSASVLFVLQRMLADDGPHDDLILMAFGPGLTVETMSLRP